jgi:CubicO group peptidase (beta-lactamase class C family)
MRARLLALGLTLLAAPALAQTAPAAPPRAPEGAGGTGALAAGITNLAPVRPVQVAPEDEALARKRFAELMDAGRSGRGLETYDPMEAVPGAPNWRALPKARPNQRTIAPEALSAARAYAARNNSNALIIWRNGRIEEEAYFGDGRTAQTPIVSRSLAKPMTAAVVGRAIALGKIKSLDQPVADFFPEWRNDLRAKITVRMLLNMTSGFLPQDFSPDPAHILNRAYLHPRHDEIIVNEYPITHEPGTRYEYNNATSEMVAPLIERATGMRYGAFLSKEVLKPLGALGGEVWVNRPGGVAHSGCCLLIPPESWVRLAILFSQDGVWQGRRLLPSGYVTQMRTGSPQYPYYGLGVYVAGRYIDRRGFANPERPAPKVLHSEPYLASDLFLFDGNGNQVVYVIPSQNLVILRTGNPPPRGGPEWDNAYLPNTILRGIVKDARPMTPQPRT